MAKKLIEIQQRQEMIRMNNEEGFADELPEDEEMDDDEARDKPGMGPKSASMTGLGGIGEETSGA